MSKPYLVTAKREVHGMTKTPEYTAWYCAKTRANNPNIRHAKWYKNVNMCERWQKSFLAFYKDMGQRPSPKHTLDRVDNTKDYSPENCVWATWTQQQLNKRIKSTNKTGYTGISISGKKFRAKYKNTFLGSFSTVEEANQARLDYVQEQMTTKTGAKIGTRCCGEELYD